jgi:hypothetical protein
MSVQDDKSADQDTDQEMTEKPEPDEGNKKKAAEMMEAYKEKPTIVLPGTGGSVSGTAVNEWLDEDGNPKHEVPDDAGSDAGSEGQPKADDGRDEQAVKDQVEKDKALNDQLREAATAENKGEKR